MEFETPKSKVYIKTDDQGRILRCEGGYTTPADLTGWTEIDEGTGDRYNLAQSHYFDGGLYTPDGIPRYRWDGSQAVLRTGVEIEEDRKDKLQDQEILHKIDLLKQRLQETDYQAIKFAEGWLSEEEFSPLRSYRQSLRDKINQLEAGDNIPILWLGLSNNPQAKKEKGELTWPSLNSASS